MSLFEELKRRNVFRVGIAYGVAAWVLLQVADLVLENINAPDWVIQAMMLMVGLGFIAALVIAWAYEMTPEGIKKESDVDRSQSVTADTGRKMDRIIIGFLVVAVAVLLYRQTGVQSAEEPAVVASNEAGTSEAVNIVTNSDRKSIAVLPFRDMSAAGDQAYFGEGIAEELLNSLVKIKGLKVASRTTAFSLAGENLDIPSIAERLDVAHILEGSIRTAGQQVRVTAQLIDVNEDVHLWSETYDGSLDDIFKIQDEITSKITAAMKVQLGETNLVATSDLLTSNAAAYQMYLQGRHLWRQRNAPALLQAQKLFEGAVKLDPEFHQAWSNLAVVYLNLPDYDSSFDTEEEFDRGLGAANRALEIEPQSTEALIIKAEYQMFHCHIADGARLYEQAIASNPLDPTAHHWYSITLAAAGHLEKALQQIQLARAIDPLISAVIATEATLHRDSGNYDTARTMHRQAAALGIYGGSMSAVGLDYLIAGEIQKGKDLFMESTRTNAPEVEARNRLFLEALQDREKVEAFTEYLGFADKPSYELIDVMELLAALGSPHAMAYQSRLECPWSEGSLWSEPFREQRAAPEFFAFMEKAGIVDFWREYGWPDDCASLNQNLAECPE
ncbi:MAG: tetratricopeptide repeat protein [Xanthomonadales bacterium]|nr:tetratricopeptide repeat protein [Xanthomonadales bacterium]